ncbi:hypothetical protein [Sorangium sp. So ce1151]|uniref:hypothetical protein n=1 Tax=Sorangium sp. So ce1151 TaxID=3133332 RepID=UPI003F5E43F5
MLAGSVRKRFEVAARELWRIPVQGSPEDVFEALARCAPIACGLVGTMSDRASTSIASHLVRLPPGVSEGWATTPRAHLTRMLAPLVPAAPGTLISETEAITGQFRQEVEILRRIRAASLGQTAGYKVAALPTEAGTRVHRFMTFALDDGRTFTREHRALLALLQPAIHAALDRLGVPLVASQSILAQVVEEQDIGFMCVSRGGTIVEVNERMHALVKRFLRAARLEDGRGAFAKFAERALVETLGQRPWFLMDEDGFTQAKISTHRLAKEAHVIGEDLQLIMMQELPASRPAAPLGHAGLTGTQQDIARSLLENCLPHESLPLTEQTSRLTEVFGGLDDIEQKIVVAMFTTTASNKQIAADMGFRLRAFEKRVQRIADKLNIHVPRGTRVRPLLIQQIAGKTKN